MTHYSEGICSDGAAILKDGSPMPVEEIVAKLNRLAELEQEEPERVCALCKSQKLQDNLHPIVTAGEYGYVHQHKRQCVKALYRDNAELQQENQRLRKDPTRAVERFGMGVQSYRGQTVPEKCEHCGLPADHTTVFQCIDDLWEHVREERAKALELAVHHGISSPQGLRALAQAIREGRE